MAAEISEEVLAQLIQLLESGQKIQAIKIYRETTGVGLKEAKEAVEALGVSAFGEKYSKMKTSGSGCCTAIVLLLVLGAVLVDLSV
tara:strand:- start:655 stop:912 length:258 start_codon:yes stop_codon:yes gene_type:complete